MIAALATDHDHPPDETDDLSGDEVFHALGSSVDGCGEPRFAFADSTLVSGTLETPQGDMPIAPGRGALTFERGMG